jgi:phosphoglycolate phosphatase
MSEYDVIIFDLDGTLTDPKIGITKSVQYALSKFGINECNVNNLDKFIGPPLLESFRKYYFPKDSKARKAVEYYREYFTESGIYENKVYPGIPNLMKQLQNSEKQLIVATSKPTIFAERILKHFGLSEYFSSVVGSNLDCTRTLKDEIIQHILSESYGIQRQNMVIIGDREQDIIAANNNEIDSIAVTYGYGSIEELQKANPTYFAKSVDDLKRILDIAN